MSSLLDARRYLSDFEPSRVGHLLTDVLVIGTGVAGARAALEAAKHGQVITISKADADESNTRWAQGGVAAAIGPGDSPRQHFEDTLRVGCGLNSHRAVDLIVLAAPAQIEDLLAWGTKFDYDDNAPARTREGGHSQFRVLHAKGDATGKELVRALLSKLQHSGRIRVFEDCFLIDLLTSNGRCVGASTYHAQYGHQLIWAKQTILASGGCGQIFRETTNSTIATGDGLAAAYRAGAVLADLEMMQFHPTTLYIAGSSRALISEAVRGEGAHLVDQGGVRFMTEYHPDGELAPRDIVSRAIRDRIRQTGGTCVYLDVRHLDRKQVARRFPWITRRCQEFGINVAEDLIPVYPGAHYMIGGVVTDLQARTNVDGLLACGEAACTGVHGANRLASNSLLEGLTFGAVAGRTAGVAVLNTDTVGPSMGIESRNPRSPRTELDLPDVQHSLRSIMWRNVGIARTGDRLRETAEIMEFWSRFVMDKTFDDPQGWETQNMLLLARLVAQAAKRRSYSLGVHYRTDADEEVPPHPTHYLIRRSEAGPVFGQASIEWEPVVEDDPA